jgi:hypothetical protein
VGFELGRDQTADGNTLTEHDLPVYFWGVNYDGGSRQNRDFNSKSLMFNDLESCGWEAGIRTPITWSRATCPTVERPPSRGGKR